MELFIDNLIVVDNRVICNVEEEMVTISQGMYKISTISCSL